MIESKGRMSQFDASDIDVGYVQCVVFENVIKGGKWFARIKHGEWMVALCCPLCTETFERSPHAYIRGALRHSPGYGRKTLATSRTPR